MQQTNEEIIYHDFNFVCDQLYRLIVEGRDTIMTYKEMFAFLEQLSVRLKEYATNSKYDIADSKIILSNGMSAGEYYRSLTEGAIIQKLIKLDHLEELRRSKNRRRRVNYPKRDLES